MTTGTCKLKGPRAPIVLRDVPPTTPAMASTRRRRAWNPVAPRVLPLIAPGYLAVVATIVGNAADARVSIAALGCLGIIAIVALLGAQ